MTNSVMQLINPSVSQWLAAVQRWWDACEKGARGLYFTTGGLFPDSFKQKAIACWMGGWQREGDKRKWQGGGRSPWERPQPRHRGAGGAGEDKKLGDHRGATPLPPLPQLLSFTSISLSLSLSQGGTEPITYSNTDATLTQRRSFNRSQTEISVAAGGGERHTRRAKDTYWDQLPVPAGGLMLPVSKAPQIDHGQRGEEGRWGEAEWVDVRDQSAMEEEFIHPPPSYLSHSTNSSSPGLSHRS